jgi:predicted amidophosphoribosyltransferase
VWRFRPQLEPRRWARALGDAVLSVVFAPPCAACGELLDHPTRGPVCDGCWQSVRPLPDPLCECCGDPLPSWRVISVPMARCARCRRGRRLVDRALAAGAYDGALRAVVHALKYEGRRSLARPLAALMRSRCEVLFQGADCLVPVPLHASRRRARGFDQALDLARHLSANGPPVRQALRRIRPTPTQTGLPAAQRHRNMRVDDVNTTGATLEACASVLREMGVDEVRAVTAARAVLSPR